MTTTITVHNLSIACHIKLRHSSDRFLAGIDATGSLARSIAIGGTSGLFLWKRSRGVLVS